MLDRRQPADRADEEEAIVPELATDRTAALESSIGRHEALGIDAVADLRDPSRRHTDARLEIAPDLRRQRDEPMDERTQRATLEMMRLTSALDVAEVPAVFAVNAHRHARERRGPLRFRGGDVARMDDRRSQLAKETVQLASPCPGALLSAWNVTPSRVTRCLKSVMSVSATIA